MHNGCNRIEHQAHNRHEARIRQLRGNVVDVVALAARGSHNGCIRNRGAVVAHNRAAEAGRNGNAHHLADLIREDVDNDWDQDAERTPGGTRRKREAAADRKHDAGQEANQGLCGTFQSTMNELFQAEAAGRGSAKAAEMVKPPSAGIFTV